jgi:leucyl-tRNA---protein transferase
MTISNCEENFLCLNALPAEMDRLWAEGWRHFGIFFFRYRASSHHRKRFNVLPLRIDLERFNVTRSQKRVLKTNQDTKIVIEQSSTDEAKEVLFAKHRLRFAENIPSSLDDFLSPAPATIPCTNMELCVYLRDKLVGVTFLDLGKTATSAVYAIFEPEERKRSLGILMMLHSVHYSRRQGYRYYYPGYAYREPSAYDYKKRFNGLEYLEWDSGWNPFVIGNGS